MFSPQVRLVDVHAGAESRIQEREAKERSLRAKIHQLEAEIKVRGRIWVRSVPKVYIIEMNSSPLQPIHLCCTSAVRIMYITVNG